MKRPPFKCPAKTIALSILIAGIFIGLFTGAEQAQNAPAAGTQAAPVGNAENGKKLFNSVGCWMCHGYSGREEQARALHPIQLLCRRSFNTSVHQRRRCRHTRRKF